LQKSQTTIKMSYANSSQLSLKRLRRRRRRSNGS
jgi:hypothetical protein